jgi:UDP-glucose 4-epimerase
MIYGDGLQTRDFVYVGDVAAAVLSAAGHDGGVFNIGTGKATSVNELHAACRQAASSPDLPAHGPARPGDVSRSLIDPGLAARELGWRPETPLADGLVTTWAATRKD